MTNSPSTVPLGQLLIAETNVRSKAYDPAGIARLADQIAAKGRLIEPLKGARASTRKVGIHDGGRRLTALQLLKDQGRLPESLSAGIPVIMDDDDRISQIETSIMSNERENFSPIEECKAFGILAGEGVTNTEIANRFGITERVVAQRLALADVHPEIIAAFEDDRIDLPKLQAYTFEPDQAVQLRVFNSVMPYTGPREIRRLLAETDMPVTSQIVQFIGLDAYRDAGGAVREDLFDEDASVCCDPALVRQLASDKLDELAAQVAEEGWKWVEVHLDNAYQFTSSLKRIYPQSPTLTESASARVAELQAELQSFLERQDEIAEIADQRCEGSEEGVVYNDEELDELETLADSEARVRQEIGDIQAPVYTDDQMANAGVVVTLHGTSPFITRGLVRSEDEVSDDASADGAEPDKQAPAKSALLGKGLAEDLNLAVQVSMQARIATDEATAFLLSTAWLASSVFGAVNTDKCLIYAAGIHFRGSTGVEVAAEAKIVEGFETWAEKLRGVTDLVAELSEWAPSSVRALHAFCAAQLYCRQALQASSRVSESHQRLRELLAYNVRDELEISGEILGRLTRAQLLDVLAECWPDGDVPQNAKKAELVALAAKHVGDWMPAQLLDDGAYGRVFADPAEVQE